MPTDKNMPDPKRFSDEQTDKRVHEHLLNKDDVISEDDIKNIRTDVVNEDQADVVESDDDVETKKNVDGKHVKDNTDNSIDNTSWNILGS